MILMPTAPIIIPLIVSGLMLGSLLASGQRRLSKKRILGVSVITGLLNTANAYLVYTLFPPTFTRFGGGAFAGGTLTGAATGSFQFRGAGAGATSEGSFLLLSFITGVVIVLAVVGIALLYARHKSQQPEEETEETKAES